MTSRLVAALLLSFAAAAPEAAQQTYKWVDAKGVVNYSNAPPAEAAARIKTVDQRISIVGPDPSVGLAVAAMREREARRAEYDEREWRQRQSALLMQQSRAGAYCYPGADCGASFYPETYYPYYSYPAFYGYRYGGALLIGSLRPHPAPHVHTRPAFHSRGVATHGGGRGGSLGGRGSAR